jgi:DNA-binding MarR family transcriptional regulator
MEDILVSEEDIVNEVEHLDHVGRILEQWHRERPELDVSPLAVIGRLHRLADALNVELRALFAEAGLSDGDFDVLASLRRAGEPCALTPTELATTTMVTSGAVTKRVDRLEAQGYVSRTVSAGDARSRVIALTPAGRSLIDDLFPKHVENERRLLAGLSATDRADLARLLEKWSLALD